MQHRHISDRSGRSGIVRGGRRRGSGAHKGSASGAGQRGGDHGPLWKAPSGTRDSPAASSFIRGTFCISPLYNFFNPVLADLLQANAAVQHNTDAGNTFYIYIELLSGRVEYRLKLHLDPFVQ